MHKNSRRNFLKTSLLGACSVPLVSSRILFGKQNLLSPIKKGEMLYRRLGRTNLLISEISLGGSPLPDWTVIRKAVERGVNYIDTSHSYMNGNCERQVGRLCKEVGRDQILVGAKFHLMGKWTEKSIIRSVEGSLKRLQTDRVEILSVHGIENEDSLSDDRLLGAFEKLKKAGKFKFKGFSCHVNHHKIVSKAVETGQYDVIQLAYNIFDIQDSKAKIETYNDYLGVSGTRRLISLARTKDIGVIAIKVLKVGGKRQNLEKYKTPKTTLIQAMLKWALDNRNISSVLTEMLTFQELDEDLSVVGQSLSPLERTALIRYVAENSKDYCHMCGQCRDNCPSGIETTAILRYLTYYEGYEKVQSAKHAYAHLKPESKVSFCQNCGQCEQNCPYGVSVRKRIRKAHQILSA